MSSHPQLLTTHGIAAGAMRLMVLEEKSDGDTGIQEEEPHHSLAPACLKSRAYDVIREGLAARRNHHQPIALDEPVFDDRFDHDAIAFDMNVHNSRGKPNLFPQPLRDDNSPGDIDGRSHGSRLPLAW